MLEVLVCAYGDHADITINAINKIMLLADNPRDLRILVGTNACCKKTTDWLRDRLDAGEIAVLVESVQNRNKDPTMRVLIEHCENPYFVWFDDDTYPCKQGWDTRVKQIIAKDNFDVAGLIHVTHRDTYAGYKDFLSKRPWFKGWDVVQKAPDTKLHENAVFPHGAFWIARTDFLRKHNFPDRDMIKKADDMLLGELCAQVGGRLIQADTYEFIKLNDGPRRGTGETATDGWKGVVIDTPRQFDGLTVYPTGGMCNRLRNVITAIMLCREEKVPLRVVWENDSTQIAGVDLLDYWTLPPDVVYESRPWRDMAEMHEREAANRYLRVPRAKLRGAYHNHWGFTCLEGEAVDDRRLALGIQENVLRLQDRFLNKPLCLVMRDRIGVHIRAFEFLFGERQDDQIAKLIESFKASIPQDSLIFLSTDSLKIQQAFMAAYPATYGGERQQLMTSGTIKSDYLSRQSREDFEQGITDLYLLGSCKRVLGTKGSSFSHMAGLMAGSLTWVEGSSRSQKDWEG